jgi:hypothetical protein
MRGMDDMSGPVIAPLPQSAILSMAFPGRGVDRPIRRDWVKRHGNWLGLTLLAVSFTSMLLWIGEDARGRLQFHEGKVVVSAESDGQSADDIPPRC